MRRPGSLVTHATVASVLILALAIVVTGVITGVLLHWQAVRARDEALLAAAHAWRESLDQDGVAPWQAEHSRAPVHLSLVSVQEAGLAEPTAEGVDEDPRYRTEGSTRVLLLPVEIERGAEEHDAHAVIMARAPALELRESVGAFVAAYALVGGLVLLAAGSGLSAALRHAVSPLEQARRDVGRVVGAGQGERVPVHGPAEVQALLADVNALLDRLDAAFAAQSRFTAEAAHELRTPVTILRGEIDLALRHPRPAEALRDTLRSLSEEVDRLAATVDGLMTLARVDAGQAEQDRQPLPVDELVAQATRHEGPQIAAHGGSLAIELGPAAQARVLVNPALAAVALANLLRNARVHAPGAAVRIEAELDGRFVVLHVDDAGPGIPPAERTTAFDRLQRGAAARVQTPGLGLGLPLAREVARRHGGDCTLGDSPSGGARVSLRLPCDPVSAA